MPLESTHTPDENLSKIETKEILNKKENKEIPDTKKGYEKSPEEKLQNIEDKNLTEAIIKKIESGAFDDTKENKTLTVFQNILDDQRTFANTLANNENIIILLDSIQTEINEVNPDTEVIKNYLTKTNKLLEEKGYTQTGIKTTEKIQHKPEGTGKIQTEINKEIPAKENTDTKKIQTEVNTENISDITKDMQKLGQAEKIDENNYIIILNNPNTKLSNIQEENIKNIEEKGFIVKYIGDNSGTITQLKITSQSS